MFSETRILQNAVKLSEDERNEAFMTRKKCRIPTKSMEPSPSWDATSRSATQGFPNTLWNQVYYCVHMIPHLIPMLSQMNLVHTIPYICLTSILIL
jgi:hypothetical protein